MACSERPLEETTSNSGRNAGSHPKQLITNDQIALLMWIKSIITSTHEVYDEVAGRPA
jgi:hypothetical protein